MRHFFPLFYATHQEAHVFILRKTKNHQSGEIKGLADGAIKIFIYPKCHLHHCVESYGQLRKTSFAFNVYNSFINHAASPDFSPVSKHCSLTFDVVFQVRRAMNFQSLIGLFCKNVPSVLSYLQRTNH